MGEFVKVEQWLLFTLHYSQVDIPSAVCYTKITYLTKEWEI